MKKFLYVIIAMSCIWVILAFSYVQIPDCYQNIVGKKGGELGMWNMYYQIIQEK